MDLPSDLAWVPDRPEPYPSYEPETLTLTPSPSSVQSISQQLHDLRMRMNVSLTRIGEQFQALAPLLGGALTSSSALGLALKTAAEHEEAERRLRAESRASSRLFTRGLISADEARALQGLPPSADLATQALARSQQKSADFAALYGAAPRITTLTGNFLKRDGSRSGTYTYDAPSTTEAILEEMSYDAPLPPNPQRLAEEPFTPQELWDLWREPVLDFPPELFLTLGEIPTPESFPSFPGDLPPVPF